MEIRDGKLIISNAGGTASSTAKTYKVSIPSAWINLLKLNEDNRDIELSFDGEKIIIEPKTSFDNFIVSAKQKGHKLLKLNYYNNDNLCTTIIADYDNKTVKLQNFTDNPVYTAFGIKSNVDWEDYNSFLEERCIPKSRMGLKNYLCSIGVDEYNPLEIIKKTNGRMAEDSQWLAVEEL